MTDGNVTGIKMSNVIPLPVQRRTGPVSLPKRLVQVATESEVLCCFRTNKTIEYLRDSAHLARPWAREIYVVEE